VKLKLHERFEGARRAAPFVLLRVALVLALLELSYLLLANVTLLTPLLRSVVNPAEDVELDYDWAYSPWPGRVYVKNLALRVEDYNIQFFVGIERGTLDVRLDELPARRFHAVRVEAEGTTYRMRHKLHDVGKDARRVAAYPPIAGLADPPLYRGPHPPPIPDSEYNLWDVRIENVTTSLREVWVLEYRYRGAGRAFGSFHVKPARVYEVAHAGLELSGGRLSVAGVPVAERAKLEVGCRVVETDAQKTGLEPFRSIFASVDGTLERADLAFLDVYLEPFAGTTARGSADVRLGLRVDAGALRAGSRIDITTRDVAVRTSRFLVQAAPKLELAVPLGSAPSELALAASAERIDVAGPARDVPTPFAENVTLGLALTPDLSRPLRVLGATAKVKRAVVPELAWLEPLFERSAAPELRGRGEASLDVQRFELGSVRGALGIDLERARLARGALRLAGRFALDSRFEAPHGLAEGIDFELLRLRADGASLASGGSKAPTWSAAISSEDTKVTSLEPPRARGSFAVHVTHTEPLLPLVVESGTLRDLMVAGLGLKDMRGRVLFDAAPEGVRVEVREARSGAVTARGFLQSRPEREPDARFLLSTKVANVGVRIDRGETSVKPLVGDDWLPKNAFVLPRSSAEAKKPETRAR
jgi:hypothetical protein